MLIGERYKNVLGRKWIAWAPRQQCPPIVDICLPEDAARRLYRLRAGMPTPSWALRRDDLLQLISEARQNSPGAWGNRLRPARPWAEYLPPDHPLKAGR